jgi:predicted outer membrane repeat protein
MSGNRALEGGAIHCASTPALFADCQIADNYADASGGGAYLTGGALEPMRLRNCLVSGNAAGIDGGGVSCNLYGNVIISNTTITDNRLASLPSYGGGLSASYNSNVEVIDSIIWANRSSDGAQVAIIGYDPIQPLPSAVNIAHSDVGPPYDPNQLGGPPVYIEEGCLLNDWEAPETANYWSWDANIWDANVIEEDPNFTHGYYLSHIATGQEINSQCINVGSADAYDVGMHDYTTRIDGGPDENRVDMGYHYSRGLTPYHLTVTVKENPADPGIHGTVDPCDEWFYEGREVTVTASPHEGYYVREWYDANGVLVSLSTTLDVVMDSNKTFAVRFGRPSLIEVSGDPNAIQDAIDQARTGDVLVVAAGTYNAGINLRGKAIKITSTNPDDVNVVAGTVIDCQQAGQGFIFNSGEGADTIVEGLSIINGQIVGGNGGAIFIDSNSAPTLRNLIIRNSSAVADANGGGYGGGIYVDVNAAPVFVNCSVIDCNAARGGGAYCDFNSAALFRHCSFIDNTSTLGGGIYWHEVNWASEVNDCNLAGNLATYGAGLYCDPNASGAIVDTVFSRNIAAQDGGAIYAMDSNSIWMTDCDIAHNSALRGGGLYVKRCSQFIMTGCIIRHNTAPIDAFDPNDPNDPNAAIIGQGGGMYCWGSPVLMSDCVITYNIANTSGGGLYLTGGPDAPQLINCLIINNLAGRDGAGISVNWYIELFVANCTFAGNAAAGAFGQPDNTGFGGALYCGYNSDTTVVDSILWNDAALDILEGGPEIAVGTGFEHGEPWPATLTISYCDVKGGQARVRVDDDCVLNWGDGNINLDPLFITGPLGNYYLSQTDAGQIQDSPCVDAGSDLTTNLDMIYSIDLTRYTTRTDGMLDRGLVDMGYHYESVLEPCRFCDLFLDGLINFRDFAAFALHWLDEGCSDVNDWCSEADLTLDTYVNYDDLAFFTECWLVEDTSPPVPNPSEWEVEPKWSSTPDAITMMAKTAFDAWGWDVQYFFECLHGPGHSSTWQSSTTYLDTGLDIAAEYGYRVKARDELGNETGWSEVGYVLPVGMEDTIPPAPWPYIETIYPDAPNAVTMIASSTTQDASGVEYYFECYSGDCHDSGWQDGLSYTDVNLAAETEYCYRLMARDKSANQNETGWSDVACATTPAYPDTNAPTPNPMEWDIAVADVNGYSIDGRPHEIYLGPEGAPWGYWAVMRATPDADDDSGEPLEFYFECRQYPDIVGHGGFSSGWMSFPGGAPYIFGVKVGLVDQVLDFRVKARDASLNETLPSTPWERMRKPAPPP